MLWTPSKGKLLRQSNLISAATAFGTTVTTGASAATKGTPAEIFSATNFDAYWVRVWVANVGTSATSSQCAIDILGGAATEEVLIPNLLAGGAGTIGGLSKSPKFWDFPLYIPAGTRLAAQAACERTSASILVALEILGGNGLPPWRVGGKVTTYGMGTVPTGTAVTPGNAADGSWTQIVASTTEDHFALVPSYQVGTDINYGTRAIVVDVGIGGAAAERSLGGLFVYETDSTEFMGGPYNTMPIFQDIPSGTRLAMRASANAAPDTGCNGVLHCMS